jgi:hypothetical protein
MRIDLIIALSVSLAVGACADAPTSCMAIERSDSQPCLSGAIQYTSAPAETDAKRIVPVHIDRTFSMYERAKIMRAVNEWNVALNGQVRLAVSTDNFDSTPYLAAGSRRPEGWIVARIDSKSPVIADRSMSRALAVTVGTRKAIIYVVADRLGTRDLGGIMMHEFGHALGVGHDASSQLMHPYYTGDKQRCIDQGTVRAVAAAQGLAADRMNWCMGAGDRVNVAEIAKGRRSAWTAIRSQ